jgi:hypothetical protein
MKSDGGCLPDNPVSSKGKNLPPEDISAEKKVWNAG